MPHSSTQAFKARFQAIKPSSSITKSNKSTGAHKQAAVLILVYPNQNGSLELVLTKRSEALSSHPGQISLPGGTVDDNDESHIHTAIREAKEEIGLDSSVVEVLGSMNEVILPSGFAVTPVVATMEQTQVFVPEPSEVAEIFAIPLKMVLDKGIYLQDSYIRNKVKREFYFFDYKEYYVWGATAGILHSLAQEMSPVLFSH